MVREEFCNHVCLSPRTTRISKQRAVGKSFLQVIYILTILNKNKETGMWVKASFFKGLIPLLRSINDARKVGHQTVFGSIEYPQRINIIIDCRYLRTILEPSFFPFTGRHAYQNLADNKQNSIEIDKSTDITRNRKTSQK